MITKVIKDEKTFKVNLNKVYFLIAPSTKNPKIILALEKRPNRESKLIQLDLTHILDKEAS